MSGCACVPDCKSDAFGLVNPCERWHLHHRLEWPEKENSQPNVSAAPVDAPPHNRKRELTVVCTGWPPTRAKSSVGAAAQHNTSRAKQSAAQHNQVQRKRPKWSPGRHFLPSLVCARDSQSQK